MSDKDKIGEMTKKLYSDLRIEGEFYEIYQTAITQFASNIYAMGYLSGYNFGKETALRKIVDHYQELLKDKDGEPDVQY